MAARSYYILTAVCGILGTIALTIYFSAPFWLMPLPQPDATMEQIVSFGKKYKERLVRD